MKPVVEVKNLNVDYRVGKNERVYALRDVSLSISRGESVAIVGESGCGKSTFANSLLKLLPANIDTSGAVIIKGRDVFKLSNKELRNIRGIEAGIIFQEPAASLNPVFTVKEQIEEAIKAHYADMSAAELEETGLGLLNEAGIKGSERVYNSYPHQLSGGQQQRVMIAIALSCDPDILIADEPTTALDVTVQAQIIKLLEKLKKKRKLSLILITHDLHLALELADRVVVMYAGEIVEDAPIRKEKDARHPYTAALFEIIPDLKDKKKRFEVIEGEVPDVRVKKDECYFAGRCRYVRKKCRQAHPEMTEKRSHKFRCYFPL